MTNLINCGAQQAAWHQDKAAYTSIRSTDSCCAFEWFRSQQRQGENDQQFSVA